MESMQRVVVTGLGSVAPGSTGAPAFWQRLLESKTALERTFAAERHGAPCPMGGEVEEIDRGELGLSRKELRYLDVVSTYGLVAAQEAFASAGLETCDAAFLQETGFSVGLFSGPLSLSRHESNVNLFAAAVSAYYGSVIGNITIPLQLCGPSVTHLNLDIAGVDAIGYAYELIRHGKARAMLAGGADSGFNTFVLTQLNDAGFLSTDEGLPKLACSHRNGDAHGVVLGEGAAVLVLESLESALGRGRPIYAEVLGYGNAGDGGGADAIRGLFERAEIGPDDVDCVVASATGCSEVDRREIDTLTNVFGEVESQPPTTSVTWAVGHTLGAAGAMQAVASSMILADQRAPGMAGLVNGDATCCLNLIAEPSRAAGYGVVLQSSFGFAGESSFLALGKAAEGGVR